MSDVSAFSRFGLLVALVLSLQACSGGGGASPQVAAQAPSPVPQPAPEPSPAALPCGNAVPDTIALSNTTRKLAKFEPDDGKAYFGFTLKNEDDPDPSGGDTRPLAERLCDSIKVELGGKRPTILKVQSEWIDWFGNEQPFSVALEDIKKLQSIAGSSVVPFVEWEANWLGHDSDTRINTKDIAAGKFNDYIKSYAGEVKAYGKPLFIRPICGEFNGSWWHYCSPRANPMLTSADFVTAWRRVVDIFREQGVTNVAWVWTPTDSLPAYNYTDPDWQSYYPGDDYVDWAGGDTYIATLPQQPNIFDDLYQFSVVHQKPFFLAEFGIRAKEFGYPADRYQDWLRGQLDYIESHPGIKAVLYFNRNGRTEFDSQSPRLVYMYDRKVNYYQDVDDDDFRLLAGGGELREFYARRIANPRYSSSLMLPGQ